MSLGDYLQLLDWTDRQLAKGKKGRIPDVIEPLFGAGLPTPPEPILQRLQIDQNGWCDPVAHFGRRFFVVAGAPTTIDDTTSRINQHRYHVPSATRQLLQDVETHTCSSPKRCDSVTRSMRDHSFRLARGKSESRLEDAERQDQTKIVDFDARGSRW